MYSEKYGGNLFPSRRGFFVGRFMRRIEDGKYGDLYTARHNFEFTGPLDDALLWKDEGLGLFAGHVLRDARHNNTHESLDNRATHRSEVITTYGLVDNASELRIDQRAPGASIKAGVRNVSGAGQWIPPSRRELTPEAE